MELGEWTGGWIIENSDNRGSDNRGSTVVILLPERFSDLQYFFTATHMQTKDTSVVDHTNYIFLIVLNIFTKSAILIFFEHLTKLPLSDTILYTWNYFISVGLNWFQLLAELFKFMLFLDTQILD